MKPKHTAHRTTDLLIGRSLILAETIAQDLRERLARELADNRLLYGQGELLQRARAILSETEPMMAGLIGNSDLWGWIAGYQHVAKQLPTWTIDQFRQQAAYRPPPPPRITLPGLFGDGPERIRFPQLEEAAQSLLDREILTRDDFDQVSAAAKQRAFTVANVASEDTIWKIRDALIEDIQEGTSLDTFRDRLAATLETSPIGPAHLENVYRTNVQAAFRDGREALASHPVVASVFPYQEYLPIGDGRVRPEHLALGTLGLDGTGVYRRDDNAMWDRFTPPWDFQCRCGVNMLTVSKAASKGVREAQEWQRTGEPPAVPEHVGDKIPFRPRPGFGARVGMRLSLQRMAHDVSDESRDASGKWTASGDFSADAGNRIVRDGAPIVVYHGGPPKDSFDPAHGTKRGGEYGIFVSPRKKYAEMYGGGKASSYHVSIKNPLFVEGKYEISPGNLTKDDIDKLTERGYDGIVVVNYQDPENKRGPDPVWMASEIVAFRPDQIRQVLEA